MKSIKIIKSESDYQIAINRLNQIIDSDPNSPEADELLILSLLIEHYEDQHYPIENPDPIEAIKIRLDDLGLRQKDLIGIAGSTKGRVSEILNKKRPLTLPVIRKLESFLRVPAEILIQPYELSTIDRVSVQVLRKPQPSERKVRTRKGIRTRVLNEPKATKYKKD